MRGEIRAHRPPFLGRLVGSKGNIEGAQGITIGRPDLGAVPGAYCIDEYSVYRWRRPDLRTKVRMFSRRHRQGTMAPVESRVSQNDVEIALTSPLSQRTARGQRSQSPTLASFLNNISLITSFEQLEQLVNHQSEQS